MKTVFIYSLNCPLSGQPRYIGKAVDPLLRYKKHLRCYGKAHRACWIRSLRDGGLQPVLEIIDEVPEENWQALESAYIQFFREEGFDLTNSTDGGEGLMMTSEIRAVISAAQQGNKYSLGRQHSAETRAKISASRMGNKDSLGRQHSAETRAKIGMTSRGREHSVKTRAAMSVAQKATWVFRKGAKYGSGN